jgi:hypothetical protein
VSQRDLSRAHWMRSVGTVVMGEMADDLLQAEPYRLDDSNIAAHNRRARALGDHGSPEALSRAYAIGEKVFSSQYTGAAENVAPDLQDGFDSYTHFGEPHRVFQEGCQAAVVFPLNLAAAISQTASRKNVGGFAADSLGNIARMLRRPDYQQLTRESALTKNGVWRIFTSALMQGSEDVIFRNPPLDFEFENGEVSFSRDFSAFLKTEIRKVNREASPKLLLVSYLSSSGCPVAHTGPHFSRSPEDASRLDHLSQTFDKPAEQLLQRRDRPVLFDFLDHYADALDQAHDYLVQ